MWKKNNISNVINYFISVFCQDRNDFFHLTDYFFMRHSLNFQDLLTWTFVSLVNLINEIFLCPHKSRKRSFNCIWRRQRDKWAYVVVFIIECCIITSVSTKKNNLNCKVTSSFNPMSDPSGLQYSACACSSVEIILLGDLRSSPEVWHLAPPKRRRRAPRLKLHPSQVIMT